MPGGGAGDRRRVGTDRRDPRTVRVIEPGVDRIGSGHRHGVRIARRVGDDERRRAVINAVQGIGRIHGKTHRVREIGHRQRGRRTVPMPQLRRQDGHERGVGTVARRLREQGALARDQSRRAEVGIVQSRRDGHRRRRAEHGGIGPRERDGERREDAVRRIDVVVRDILPGAQPSSREAELELRTDDDVPHRVHQVSRGLRVHPRRVTHAAGPHAAVKRVVLARRQRDLRRHHFDHRWVARAQPDVQRIHAYASAPRRVRGVDCDPHLGRRRVESATSVQRDHRRGDGHGRGRRGEAGRRCGHGARARSDAAHVEVRVVQSGGDARSRGRALDDRRVTGRKGQGKR